MKVNFKPKKQIKLMHRVMAKMFMLFIINQLYIIKIKIGYGLLEAVNQ